MPTIRAWQFLTSTGARRYSECMRGLRVKVHILKPRQLSPQFSRIAAYLSCRGFPIESAMTPEEKRKRHNEENRRWRKNHREHVREYKRRYYREHQANNIGFKEKARQRGREWCKNHPEEYKQKLRRRRERLAACPDLTTKKNRQVREWQRSHPDKRRITNHKRRAQLAAVESTLTVEQWNAIKAAYHQQCAYCGETFTGLTMDHVVPLASGGPHIASNVVPACVSCNSAKGPRVAPKLPPIRLML